MVGAALATCLLWVHERKSRLGVTRSALHPKPNIDYPNYEYTP